MKKESCWRFQSIFKCGQHPVNVGQLIKPPGQRKSKLVNKIGDSRQRITRGAQRGRAGRAHVAVLGFRSLSRIEDRPRTPAAHQCAGRAGHAEFWSRFAIFFSFSSLVLDSEGPKHLETLGFFKNDFKSCIKTFSKLLYSNVEI